MRKTYLGIGILSVVVGLLMLFAPDAWTKVVVVILGAAAVVSGVFNLLHVRTIIADTGYRRAVIVRGAISILVGLIAIILPLALAATVWTVMLYVLAAYLLVSAGLEVYAAAKLKSRGINARPYYGEIAASVVLAVVLFLVPAQLGLVLIRICGVLLVLCGAAVIAWEARNRGPAAPSASVSDAG